MHPSLPEEIKPYIDELAPVTVIPSEETPVPDQEPETPEAEELPVREADETPVLEDNSPANDIPDTTLEVVAVENIEDVEEMPALITEEVTDEPEIEVVQENPTPDTDDREEKDIEELPEFEMTNNPLDSDDKPEYNPIWASYCSEPEEAPEAVEDNTPPTQDSAEPEGELEKEQTDLYHEVGEDAGEDNKEWQAGSMETRESSDRRPSRTMYEELEEKSRILDESLQRRKKVEEPAPKDIKQCLTVSKKIILFGAVIPGQIKEQRLLIENFSTELLTLRVRVDCCNQEFDELDEYVLSIRKPPQYDYNDTYFVMMNEKDYITFHVAIKVPKLKQACEILGKITITAQGLAGKYEVYLSSDAKIPLIYCPKMLMVHEIGMEVVPFT